MANTNTFMFGMVLEAEYMKAYKFYDHDDRSDSEYDIEGENFDLLIALALKYCKYFSLAYSESIKPVKELEPFEFGFEPNEELRQKWEYYEVFHSRFPRKYYILTPESASVLRNIADGIFKFTFAFGYEKPEDPAFFRDDDSAFFVSVVHEGECCIFAKNNEDVHKLIESSGQWHELPLSKTSW